MIDPIESHKTLGRIFIACLLGILLYLLVGAGMTFMDKIGLGSNEAKLQQQISNYQQEISALKSQNDSLQKSLEAEKKNTREQIKAITENNKQILQQKEQEKKQLQTLMQKQTPHHSAISSSTIVTDTTITLNRKQLDDLSSDNIQAINSAYNQFFGESNV